MLLVEGKRTETVSSAVQWYSKRNQVVRNVEAARALAGARDYGVIVCAEDCMPIDETCWAESLPHLPDDERSDIQRHYLGCITWRVIADKFCDGLSLPETVACAVEQLVSLADKSALLT